MKFLHTSITVKNMEESIQFYKEIIGLKLIKRREIKENNAEIAFLSDSESGNSVELTYWFDKDDYNEGDELDHLAFATDNLTEAIIDFRNKGVNIAKEPYSLRGSDSKIAFITDPNGIWIELIENK